MVELLHPLLSNLNPDTGLMDPYDTHRQVRLGDMPNHYLSGHLHGSSALNQDTVLYEVFELSVPEKAGDMIPCSTILHPGLVGDEFFMTKGHFHKNREAAEIYYCLHGEGLLLMQQDDECIVKQMNQQTLIYVPAGWAHRSVNVGSEDLVILAVYPADAGHEYGFIEKSGFAKRIFSNGEKGYIVK